MSLLNQMDLRTTVYMFVVTAFVCTLIVMVLALHNRRRYAGLGFWVADCALQTLALVLVGLRDFVPDGISVVVPAAASFSGTLLAYQGLLRFADLRAPVWPNWVLVAAGVAVHGYFLVGQPDLAARNLNFAIVLLALGIQIAWLLLYGVPRSLRPSTLPAGLVFAAYNLINAARILHYFLLPEQGSSYFHAGSFNLLVMVVYQVLFVFLAFSLVLMYVRRLLSDIRTQEALVTAAFDSAPYAITLTRLEDGRLVQVNRGFCEITGFEPQEVTGRSTIDLLWYREEDRVAVVEELHRSNRVRGLELTFRRKSGELIRGLFSADLIQMGCETYALTSIADITERVRAEADEARLRETLVERQRLEAIGTLARGVAHDINNPLTVVNNFAELIREQLPPGSDAEEMARQIVTHGERIARIVKHLLTFARGDREEPVTASVVDIVEPAIRMLQNELEQDGIRIEDDYPEELPPLTCRRRQIQQVLVNLLTNARDALNARYPEGDPDKLIRVSVQRLAGPGAGFVRISVENHGADIPAAVKQRLFEPFFTTKPRGIGTGLGLSVSYGIVVEHGGAMTVETEPGRFARFHVDLPIAP